MGGAWEMTEDRWLVVGLGNPGRRYARTRHNAGFLVADVLADRVGGKFKGHKSGADVLEGRLAGAPVVLAKPRAYINVSGAPVAALRSFYKVPVDRVVVVHDDLDLDFGVLRLKSGGGMGGHNGLRSITQSLNTPDYLRVRFGIGRPPGRADPVDYVLGEFAPAERKELGVHLERAADAVEAIGKDGLEAAQNVFHAS